MKNIVITLDDVIRAKTLQIGRTYKKYKDHTIKLETLDFSHTDYAEIFNFETLEDYQKFLYQDYVLEIFGSAPTVNPMIPMLLNNWIMTVNDDYEETDEEYVNVLLSNAFEFNISIANTYFFLSKLATRVREVFFPVDSSKIWDKADIVITATPEILNSKPDDKIAIKIDMDYNKDCPADYTYKTLNDFFKDIETINNIRK